MRHLIYALALALGLASCATSRPHTYLASDGERRSAHAAGPIMYEATPETLEPPANYPMSLGVAVHGKSRAKVARQSSRVLKRWHRQFQRDARRHTKASSASAPMPRKCKGCTIVYGDATVAGKKAQVAAGAGATASVIEKKAGPAQVASDSSTQNSLSGAGNLATVHGNGNSLPQTATTQQAADWRAVLAKPAGQVGAAVAGLAVVGGAGYLFILWRRRRAIS